MKECIYTGMMRRKERKEGIAAAKGLRLVIYVFTKREAKKKLFSLTIPFFITHTIS